MEKYRSLDEQYTKWIIKKRGKNSMPSTPFEVSESILFKVRDALKAQLS